MEKIDLICMWIAEIVPLSATLFSLIYGLSHFFKKGKPLFLQSITMAMGCHALGKDALPEIKQERENARRAFVLGVNTAIPYGIVRIDEGYGTVTELLNAVSVTKLIRENPNDLTEALKYYVDMLKTIHSIEAEDGEFPDIKQRALGWVDFIASHLPEVQVRKLRALIEDIPKKNTLQHGDYHTNNIMVQNGEPLLIDMDTLCMGHPVFELATMFNAFIGFDKLSPQHSTMNFFGFDFETSKKFFELAVKAYLGTDDEAVCQAIVEKAMLIGYVKLLRHTLRRKEASDYAERIAHCQEKIAELLEKTDCLYY